MKPLSMRASAMPPSGIREVMELAWKTPGCIHLEVGQPDFPTPEHICEAGIEAIRKGFIGYTPARGIPELRSAIIDKIKKQNGYDITDANITVCPGAVTALDSAIMAVVEAGDEILMPDPGWPNPESTVRFLGAIPVHFHLRPEQAFLPDPDEMAALITPKTKAIMINTPSNPTGAVYPKELLARIYQLARKHDLYIFSDEVYEDLIFDGHHVSIRTMDPDERVISVYGLSKSYSMTGWRLGYVIAARPISDIITKLQEPLVSCASLISQKAAEAALRGPRDVIENMRATYHRRRDIAVEILKKYDLYEYTPGGAFYLMVNVSRLGSDSRQVALDLLREAGVATAPGTAFGVSMNHHVRVSLSFSDEDIRNGMERICQAIAKKN